MNFFEVRDPVYGFITFNDWEREIINHRVFQRLRRIRQLALTDMVYPGATHTRFEHSLGVMHLATLMYDAIIRNDNNKNILKKELHYNEKNFKRDRQIIRLAALLHDVGHAPFSHASEEIMPLIDETKKPYKHEDYTSAIINDLLKDVIENHKINKTDYNIKANEVAAMIEGNATILEKRLFWKVIISSQLDADRGDYLLRDSYHIGVKYGVYDHWRLLNTLALGIEPESSEVVLGVNKDGWHVAESIVIARYQMFTQVYFHKTRRAFDYHLREAMKKVIKNKKLPSPKELENFIKLDDNTMWELFKKRGEDFNCKAILSRDHMREIYSTSETPSEKDEKEMEGNINKLKEKDIWFHVDKAESLWYKLNNDDKENKEIMIINNNSAYPLSKDSSIVKNMKEIRQIRIYVKLGDKERAKEVLK